MPKILFVGLVKGRIIGKATIRAGFKGWRALVQKLVGINKAFGGNIAPNRGVGGLFNNAVQLIFYLKKRLQISSRLRLAVELLFMYSIMEKAMSFAHPHSGWFFVSDVPSSTG